MPPHVLACVACALDKEIDYEARLSFRSARTLGTCRYGDVRKRWLIRRSPNYLAPSGSVKFASLTPSSCRARSSTQEFTTAPKRAGGRGRSTRTGSGAHRVHGDP